VIVVGQGGRRISCLCLKARPMEGHVAGTHRGTTSSARGMAVETSRQACGWRARTFDTFAPSRAPRARPPPTRVDPTPHALGIRLRLKGGTMQDSQHQPVHLRVDPGVLAFYVPHFQRW